MWFNKKNRSVPSSDNNRVAPQACPPSYLSDPDATKAAMDFMKTTKYSESKIRETDTSKVDRPTPKHSKYNDD